MSMFIGRGLSLEACHAAHAERRAANTATAAASAAAAAAAASTAAATATERASSASPPLFALSPPAKMDSIASPPTGASPDGPSPASIAGSLAGSLAPLVYAEDFYLEHNRSVHVLVVLCHGLTHDDGTPAIEEHPLSDRCRRLTYLQRTLSDGDDDDPHDGIGAPSLRSAGAMGGGGVYGRPPTDAIVVVVVLKARHLAAVHPCIAYLQRTLSGCAPLIVSSS
jgi:hypothetical protein